MKYKKILAVMLCSLLIIAYMPVFTVTASEKHSLNIPDFMYDSGYFYEDSEILWGSNSDNFNFIEKVGFSPLDVFIDELIDTDYASLYEQDFVKNDVYFQCYFRGDINGSIGLFYDIYFVPKNDDVRLALFNNQDDHRIYVYCTDKRGESIKYVNYRVQLVKSGDKYNLISESYVSDIYHANTFGQLADFENTVYRSLNPNNYKYAQFISTNMAMFDSEYDAKLYADSAVDNSINGKPNTKVGCDSFGWDSFDLVYAGNRYDFVYSYSDDYMLSRPELCYAWIDCVSELRYKDALGTFCTVKESSIDSFDLSVYPSRYTSDGYKEAQVHWMDGLITGIGHCIDLIIPGDPQFVPDDVVSLKSYITVTLKKGRLDPSSNLKITIQTSSDVRTFCIDHFTGDVTDLSKGTIVKSESRYDDDGNEVDRVVTDIVVNDNSTNTTVGHYEVNDTDQTITNTETNVTVDALNGNEIHNNSDNDVDVGVGGGSGSGSSGSKFPGSFNVTVTDGDPPLVIEDDDFKLRDAWKYFKSMFGLLDDPNTPEPMDGALSQLVPIFGWLPPEFTYLLLGGISSNAIISAIKIARH